MAGVRCKALDAVSSAVRWTSATVARRGVKRPKPPGPMPKLEAVESSMRTKNK